MFVLDVSVANQLAEICSASGMRNLHKTKVHETNAVHANGAQPLSMTRRKLKKMDANSGCGLIRSMSRCKDYRGLTPPL